MARYSHCAWFAVALGVVPVAWAEGPLSHDPFTRPPLSATVARTLNGQPETVSEDVPWTPSLSAVVVAGKNSMVNVNGAIVTLGENIEGHRLIEVNDQEAVFKKGKKRIVLKIQTSNLRQHKERAVE